MNRFKDLFELFKKQVEPLIKEGEAHTLVFSYKHDAETNTGEFAVYRNVQFDKTLRFFMPGYELVQPGNELVYEDTVWFFYESVTDQTLEAHMCFMPQHRPRIVVQKKEPILKAHVSQAPYISGLTQLKASEPA